MARHVVIHLHMRGLCPSYQGCGVALFTIEWPWRGGCKCTGTGRVQLQRMVMAYMSPFSSVTRLFTALCDIVSLR
jgi:hypothetical protein